MKINRKICVLHESDEPQIIWKNVSGIGKVCKSCFIKKCAPKSYGSISTQSIKRVEQDKEYHILRKEFLKKNPMCQMKFEGICQLKSSDAHHSIGRQKNYLDVSTFIACCRACHFFCETHPEAMRELGFIKSRLTK